MNDPNNPTHFIKSRYPIYPQKRMRPAIHTQDKRVDLIEQHAMRFWWCW